MTHNFIEVTFIGSANEHNELDEHTRKTLINTRWIEQVIPSEDYTTIYLAFETNDGIEPDFVKCKESYEEIKNMLW